MPKKVPEIWQYKTCKHCENRKTLPWEHHIGCQMCQIALSNRTEKVNLKNLLIYSSDGSESSEKNDATSLKIISVTKCQLQNFCYKISVTKFQLQNFSYKIWVTKFELQNLSYKILVTKF